MNRVITPLKTGEVMSGIKSGLPIFIGYFTTSVAFGILATSSGLSPFEAVLFSASNLTGAAQFMAINLMASGSAMGEIVTSVVLMNLRYFIMSASLARKIGLRRITDRAIISFGVTDEVFSVAALKAGTVSPCFMYGLQGISWLGWTAGTLAGVTAGSFLSPSLQDAMSGALFALFAALLVPEMKKGIQPLFLAAAAGAVNTLLYYIWHVSEGWSIVISMLLVTAAGAALFKDDENNKPSGAEA